MAFADVVATKDALTIAHLVDVYVGATLTYRWADCGVDSATYEHRIVELGSISRGFGDGRVMAPALTTLDLRNEDGGVDWLCARSAMSGLGSDLGLPDLRFDVSLLVSSSAGAGSASKALGSYQLADWPTRDADRVRLSLSDVTAGALESEVLLPTIGDLADAWLVATGLKLCVPSRLPLTTPIPMAFGSDWVECMPGLIPQDATTAAGGDADGLPRMVFPVCCAGLSAADLNAGRVVSEWGVQSKNEGGARAPPFRDRMEWTSAVVSAAHVVAGVTTTVSLPRRKFGGIDITKNGKTWTCVFLEISGAAAMSVFDDQTTGRVVVDPNAAGLIWHPQFPGLASDEVGFLESDLHGVDVSTAPPRGTNRDQFSLEMLKPLALRRFWVRRSEAIHAATLTEALLDDYAQPAVSFDTTSLALWESRRPGDVAAGQVGERSVSLRDTLGHLARSFDVDLFVTWAGEVAVAFDSFSSLYLEVGADSLTDFDEEDMAEVADRLPSAGDRHRPATHARLGDAKGNSVNPAAAQTGQGAHALVSLAAFSSRQLNPGRRTHVAEVGGRWRPYDFLASPTNGMESRDVTTTARSRFAFTTGLRGLLLDLGDFYRASWSRNVATVYSGAYFQLERQTYHPRAGTVRLEGVWRAESTHVWPYLLDDEAKSLKASDGGGLYSATVTNSSATINFTGGINLTTAGVVAGDVLWLLDTAVGAGSWSRFRALRIVSVVDSDTVTVESGDLAFEAASPTDVDTWEIHAGATTLAAWAGTHAADYPNGSAMFGAVADASTAVGEYSDATEAHKLGDG